MDKQVKMKTLELDLRIAEKQKKEAEGEVKKVQKATEGLNNLLVEKEKGA